MDVEQYCPVCRARELDSGLCLSLSAGRSPATWESIHMEYSMIQSVSNAILKCGDPPV